MPRPKSPNPLTGAERTKRSREALVQRGGWRATIEFEPEETRKLDTLQGKLGIANKTEVIRQLVRDA